MLPEWARRAEELGFSTLATIDRIVYPSYESLVTLAAAGAVTERIGLMTNILIAPVRNPVLLAKEAASVDRISSGRLTLGLAPGGGPTTTRPWAPPSRIAAPASTGTSR